MSWFELVLFSGAVYGASWTITCSKLLSTARSRVSGVPILGYLVQCIVCMSFWVALGFVVLLRLLGSHVLRGHLPLADCGLLVCWSIASTWVLGRALGDAD